MPSRTDKQWQEWSVRDPYYAVLAYEDFHGGRNREEFFRLGEEYFDRVIREFEILGIPLDPRQAALDYGCGVGRVLRPMSNYFDKVIGLDIAPKMVEIASRNVPKGIVKLIDQSNISDVHCDSPFGFVHSTLVLQHVQARMGMKIIQELLRAIAPGGRALIQIPTQVLKRGRYALNQIRYSNSTLFNVSRFLLRDKNWSSAPSMEMNAYPLKKVIRLCDSYGIRFHLIKSSIDSDRYLVSSELYLSKDTSRDKLDGPRK